jgi:serine phosphatase RsbU (regulator of sigma subunit)/anti-sigma regulatory factor (Ser/Thr protein kinase)
MNWLEMIVKLIGAIAVIDLMAVLLAGTHSFSNLANGKNRTVRHVLLGVTGGLFGIYATMAGYAMPSGAQISIRDVGALIGGALGGPIGGLIAGFMAAFFRLFYPFVTAGLKGAPVESFSSAILAGTTIPCAISTLTIGVVSGFFHEKFKKAKHRGAWACLMGFVAEVFHLTLAFAYLCIPIESISRAGGAAFAWTTLKELIIPFLLSNSLAFGILIYVFDKMRNYSKTEAHAKQVEGELNVATSIQNSMLPQIFPDFPGRKEFAISASMQPAKEVGGDFYDFFFVDDDHFAFLIADVSGKGVPAALFMVIAKTLIKNNLQSGLSLGEALNQTNQQLLEGDEQRMFVTAWVGVIQLSSGKLAYVNCGHNPPLLARYGASFAFLKDRSGFVLAGSKKTDYKVFETELKPGDRLFLYTDGITEAMNKDNQQYGEERLLHFAYNYPADKQPEDVIKDLTADVKSFVGEAIQSDDMTMVSLHFYGCYAKKKLPVKEGTFEELSSFLEKTCEKKGVPMKEANAASVILDEIYSNIAKYSKANEVTFGVFAENGLLSLRFVYGGELFDITKAKEPDVHAPLAERGVGGLGLFMVKKMSDSLSYEARRGQNIVTVDKHFTPKGEQHD